MNASVLIILFVLLMCSYCDARGGGGGGRGGSGRASRGRSHSRGVSSTPINHRAWHYGSTSKIKPSSSSSWKRPLDKPDIPSFIARRYGSSFGNRGLGQNTYLANNFFSRSHRESSLLTNVLFYHLGMRVIKRNWNFEDDRGWRATTKSPYFENKVPGSEEILPAAAVIGAATAFGLATLLPLNVPGSKPLMYCNNTELRQTQIQYKSNIYSCVGDKIAISCPRHSGNKIIDQCANKTLECDVEQTKKYLSCSGATLSTSFPIVCNSTIPRFILKLNETRTVLLCYPGSYPKNLASFIPTTTTETPMLSTTEAAIDTKVWNFFMGLFGGSDDETPNPREGLKEGQSPWEPEALTLPPNFEVPEQEYPYSLEYQLVRNVKGRNIVVKQHPVAESVEHNWLKLHLEYGVTLPPFVVKVPKRRFYPKLDEEEDSDEETSFEFFDSNEDGSTTVSPTTEQSLISDV